MWFIGLAVFFLVLEVISDLTHWDPLMLVGIVGIINSKSDLCVNERIMQFDKIPIVTYLCASSKDMSHSMESWWFYRSFASDVFNGLIGTEGIMVVAFMSFIVQIILWDSSLYFGRTMELATQAEKRINITCLEDR